MKPVVVSSTVFLALVVALVALAMVTATLPWPPAAATPAGALSDKGPIVVALRLRKGQHRLGKGMR